MKKILMILFLTTHIGFILASPIDKETVKKVAINFMNSKVGTSISIKNIISEELNGQTSFYVVNFQSGGWVMVSSDMSAIPVLGYNLYGEYKLEDEKPEAFVEITNSYKKQIEHARKLKSSNLEINSKWETLLSSNNHKSVQSYTPGDELLDVPGRGHVQWRQGSNNSGGCTPSYNAFCPNNGCYDYCNDKALVGCGAVAMGQIMWYWQWPQSSSYRTYNWSLMPSSIYNTPITSIAEGNEIANLLRDIGREDAADMTYWCSGTWTTTNKIEEAFKDKFYYNSAKKHVKNDWSYGNAWGDLLRSEIDNQRPILYRGDKSDISSSKHFFVLDGYDATDPDFFWFNFGHGGQTYNNSRHYLNDITPSGTDFDWTENQMAIVGISPTYTELAPDNVNIFDVPYTIVYNVTNEEAQQDIVLPATGKELSVYNGGELTFTAGNSITLKPGFQAKAGSKFTAQINPDFTEEMDIHVPTWSNVFSPNGDGILDELGFIVENANSWEFEVFSGSFPIFQSAGTITGNTVYVWDGSGAYYSGSYNCIIRFKNNYGREAVSAYQVYAYLGSQSAKPSDEGIRNPFYENENLTSNKQNQNNEILVTLYPNPNNGLLKFEFSNPQVQSIKIYNSQGKMCFQVNKLNQPDYNIDMSSYNDGIYIVLTEIDNQIFTQKIILEK